MMLLYNNVDTTSRVYMCTVSFGPWVSKLEQTWSRNAVHVSKLALPLRVLDLGKLGSVHLDALSCRIPSNGKGDKRHRIIGLRLMLASTD